MLGSLFPLIPTLVEEGEGMVVRLIETRGGRSRVIVPDLDAGLSGLSADQSLTGPSFSLTSTRDVLGDQLLDEIRLLRTRVRGRTASSTDRRRLHQLELKYQRDVPASPEYSGIARWRAEETEIRDFQAQLRASEPTEP